MLTEQALIEKLDAHLIALEPRPEFVRQLRAELLKRAPIAPAFDTRWLWVMAGVGGAVSLLGVLALVLRKWAFAAPAKRGLTLPKPAH